MWKVFETKPKPTIPTRIVDVAGLTDRPSLQPHEEKPDIGRYPNGSNDADKFLIATLTNEDGGESDSAEKNAKSEVESIRPMAVDDLVLEYAHNESRQQQTEKPSVLTLIMSREIRPRFVDLLRQDHRRHQIERTGLRQNEQKADKRPVAKLSQTETRPPDLYENNEHHGCPQQREPIDRHAIAVSNYPADSGEHLSYAEADDDGEQDREIRERVHGVSSDGDQLLYSAICFANG